MFDDLFIAMKKQLVYLLVICGAFLFSSCSLGLVAVHSEAPFICFKRKCREMAKMERRSGKHIINSGGRSAKLVRVKKHRSKAKSGSNKSKKKRGGTSRFN